MTTYNAYLEVDYGRMPGADRIDTLMDELAAYHPSLSEPSSGWFGVRITLPAENLDQAAHTAIAVVERATGASTVLAEVMTEAEFNARQGFTTIPELVSTTEFAEMLGVSRARVGQMIDEHKLRTATRVGGTTVIARSEAIAKALAAGRDITPYTADLGVTYDPKVP